VFLATRKPRDNCGVTCSARTAFDGPGRLPFDFRSLLDNAVGINEHDLPHSAHSDRHDLFFESFQPPRKISTDHFVSSMSSAAIAGTLHRLSTVARIPAHGNLDLESSRGPLVGIDKSHVDYDGICVGHHLLPRVSLGGSS
jgi:hypothetical protein